MRSLLRTGIAHGRGEWLMDLMVYARRETARLKRTVYGLLLSAILIDCRIMSERYCKIVFRKQQEEKILPGDCLSYSSKWELTQAVKRSVTISSQGFCTRKISARRHSATISPPATCDSDLLIRTGGEQRISISFYGNLSTPSSISLKHSG